MKKCVLRSRSCTVQLELFIQQVPKWSYLFVVFNIDFLLDSLAVASLRPWLGFHGWIIAIDHFFSVVLDNESWVHCYSTYVRI